MIFVDELTPLKLYPSKRKFYAPFNEEDKKNGALIYLMGKDFGDTVRLINNPTMINRRYFTSYYTEKDVEYFMTNEAFNQVDANEFILENYLHEMTDKERQDLPDSAFGLPKDRKYPLHDEEHVKLAIRFFNNTTGDDREELAKNIKKAAKKFGMQISVGKKNKLKDYLEEGSYILEKSKPTSDDSDKEEAETLYNDFINNEQIKPEYANSDKDGIDSVYLHDTFWPILSKFIDKNKDNEYLLTYAKKKLSRFKDKDATPERYQKKAALMTFVEKEIKKIDEYLSKIEPSVDEDEEDFEESTILEAVDNSLYFLSETNMDQKVLQPRIPDNFLTKNGYEDNTTPRVCFSTSIDKCLTAMSMRLTDKEFYVHYPAEEHDVYSPSIEEVPDVKITGEKWIKEPVKLICVEKIRVTGPTRGKGMDYTYGDGKKATLYNWSWEKLESYLEGAFSEAVVIYTEMGDTPQMIHQWIKNNISYDHSTSWKLRTPGETFESKKGNCHDQASLMLSALKSIDVPCGSLFFIEYNEDEEAGGRTHTLTWYAQRGKIYWPETSWGGQEKIHGPFDDINDLKEYITDLHSKEPQAQRYPKLQFQKVGSNVDHGMNLGEYVSAILKESVNIIDDTNPIKEEFISLGLNFDCNEVTPSNYNFYKKFYPDEKIRMDQSIENYVWTDPKNDHAFVARAGISHEGDEHWIFGIFIDPNYRGHGLCKQMLANLCMKGAELIAVEKSNEFAKKIYEDFGFVTYDEVGDHYFMKHVTRPENAWIYEESVSITEARNNSVLMKKYLYADRIRSQKEVLLMYKFIKENCPMIKRTFNSIDKYKGANLFYDLSHYMEIFLNNIKLKNDRAVMLYFDFLNKYIKGNNIPADYKTRTILIPVFDNIGTTPLYTRGRLNPISIIHRMTKIGKINELRDAWGKYNIILVGETGYFKLDLNSFDKKFLPRFETLVNKLLLKEVIEDTDSDKLTAKSIANDTIETIERVKGIEIPNITGTKSLTGQKRDVNDIKSVIKDTDRQQKMYAVAATVEEPKKELSKEDEEKIKTINNKKQDTSVKAKETSKLKKIDDDKDRIVQSVKIASNGAESVEDAIENLDNDPEIIAILQQLETQENNEIKMNAARTKRMETVKDIFHNTQYKGKKVADILAEPDSKPLEQTALKVDSINPEWQEMSFINFSKAYDLDKDILDILNSFSSKSMPVAIRNIEVQNTSTSEDFIDTWVVECEDGNGQRFTLKFDVPRLKDNRFMRLRGNDKTINAQLMLLPIIKTDQDVVQIVSNYNKIFIKKFGTSGKSTNKTNRIIKALTEMLEKKETALTITPGDNSKICAKYELPIEYIDLATNFSKVECAKFVIMFNQDELYEKYGDKINPNLGTPIGYNKEEKKVIYVENYGAADNCILWTLCKSDRFNEIFNSKKKPTKANYSKASILDTEIPVIVVAGYSVGLEKVLRTAGISYELQSKRPDPRDDYFDYIKFNDGYLVYEDNVQNSLLMNGLKDCDTENHSLTEINSKEMWLDFLDEFGGRIKADGLDNFYDLMIDPMTASVCRKYGLPESYIEILIYANNLLVDNKYNRHVDITGNRYRTNELIAGYIYKSLATSYGGYKNSLKRNRKGSKMTMKQSIVIDSLLVDSTESDLSISRPLSAIESANTVSFKGLSGMNSDRSYGLDKRTYDETMINQLAMSTGFAGNVGITRQATIDMGVDSNRGYIKKSGVEDMSVTKTFCMTEALTPYGTTHDDPFRSAMTFIQTSKHEMAVAKPMPSLITNGADEAVPYLAPSIFAVKAKKKGKVIELKSDIGQEYMIIEYSDGEKEFVDLNTNIFKNSDGGFYGDIKLDTDLKIGSVVKPNDVVAYDRQSFTRHYGPNDNLAYEIGTLAKVAILNTDENFEDSAMIDNYLSEALASRVTVKIDKTFDKDTNIFNLVKKGSHIEEGDTLCIIQNSFDDADANALMKQLTGDEDEISALGRINIKSKVTGTVEDIVIYRTVEIEELSPTLQKIVKEYEKPIKEQKKIMQKHGITDFSSLKPDYKLESTGKLKNVKDGVLIEFYLSYGDKMSVGDKVVFYSANKGVVKNIFPEGDEPKSDFRPNEKINAFIGITSVNGRMVTSIQHVAAVNKLMIELDRKVKETMGVPWKTIEEMTEI